MPSPEWTSRPPPGLFSRATARARGFSDRQIDRRLESGEWVAERRGLLRASTDNGHDPSGPLTIPSDILAALLTSPARDLVISHTSAARLLDLPQPLAGWPMPQFTSSSGPTRRRYGIHVRVAPLPDEHVLRSPAPASTSAARTVVDCARILPGRDGLAIADAALRRRLVSFSDLNRLLSYESGWPGIARARAVVALADPRRETALESWSAWAFAHIGVPVPQWQVDIRAVDGAWLGRADAWWLVGVVGESDGRSKYALAAAEFGGDQAMARVLAAERRREQSFRNAGADVVRWGAVDVLTEMAAKELAARIGSALALARNLGRFCGSASAAPLPPRSR